MSSSQDSGQIVWVDDDNDEIENIQDCGNHWTVELHDEYIAFKSSKGKYLSMEPGGYLIANRADVDNWEKFQVLVHSKTQFTVIRSLRGLFLTLNDDMTTEGISEFDEGLN